MHIWLQNGFNYIYMVFLIVYKLGIQKLKIKGIKKI